MHKKHNINSVKLLVQVSDFLTNAKIRRSFHLQANGGLILGETQFSQGILPPARVLKVRPTYWSTNLVGVQRGF